MLDEKSASNKRGLFPWRLYWRYVYRQTFLFIIWFSILFFVVGIGFSSLSWEVESFALLFAQIFLFVFILAFVFFVYTGRNYARSLGRLIYRAKKLSSGKSLKSTYMDAELVVAEDQEWSELDSALRELGKEFRKKTKNLLRERFEVEALMGALDGALVAVNREGEVLFYNSKFAFYFGSNEWRNKTLRIDEVFRAPEVLQIFHDACKGEKKQNIEISMLAGTPCKEYDFSLSVSPVRRKKNNLLKPTDGAIGIFTDITVQKKTEKMRIEFVSNVSHELRTPLTSILGFTQALENDVEQKDFNLLSSYTKKIKENSERLQLLVNDLLDLSSLESSQEMVFSHFSVKEITLKVLSQLEDKIKDKKIQVHAIYKIDSLYADERRVDQALRNLVENAIKYIAPEGRIEIIWELSEDNQTKILRVIDNGPGIAEKHLERLFERFYRVDKGRSRVSGGTGLGLAIVKHILIQHGGKVFVKSEHGQGAEFICHFPVQ